MKADARNADAAQAAIGWMVELRSGEATAAEHQAFAAWLAADPAHREAWQRLAGAVGQAFGDPSAVRPGAADAVNGALDLASTRATQRRRLLRGALGFAGVGLGTAWTGRHAGLLPDWSADLHTATAERRSHTLSDGSTLLLDARSSADVAFTATERGVRLREGQLIASVQAQPGGAAPFVVHTAQGSVRALDTRFMVRQAAGRSLAVVLEHSVEVATASGLQRHVLHAGDAVWFDAARIEAVPPDAGALAAADWQRGLLVAQDLPLADVVQALRPYRHGFIRIAPDAARLRVSGSYPLADTDASLQALAETLPIDVHVYTGGWLVRIERRG